jgi:pyruvate/2-oxoglutarate/acetoin dehydrogenase E1 component
MKRTFMSLAIADAIAIAMREDRTVYVFGEDIDKSVLGPTKGLVDEFGRTRVRNTPISEQAVVGAVIGAAASGLRPVMDLMFGGFFYVAMDQIVNQLAHIRYMSGGAVSLPVVLMAGIGPEGQAGAQHSESPHAALMQAAGLKVAVPSTPADAKGLMLSAIRDPDPVVFLMDISLAGIRGSVPEGEHLVPLGRADVKREGTEVTVVAMASAVPEALKAADQLAAKSVSVEVVDLRTLVPLDLGAVLASVRKTGRLVIAEPGRRTCGMAAEVSALVVENAWDALREPPLRVTWPDVPVPFSPGLEAACRVREGDIVAGVERVLHGINRAAVH